MEIQDLVNKKRLTWWEERLITHWIEGDYFKFEGYSRSRIKEATKSMFHFWNYTSKQLSNKSLTMGTLFDKFCLDNPEKFWESYFLFDLPHPIGTEFTRTEYYKRKPKEQEGTEIIENPDAGSEYKYLRRSQIVSRGLTTKENSDELEAAQKANQGKLAITTDDLDKCQKMLESLTSKPEGFEGDFGPAKFFEGMVFNRVPLWIDYGGIRLKIELDKLKIVGSNDRLILYPADLKAVEDASESGFKKGCRSWAWDIQDNLYCFVLEQIFPDCEVRPMTFLLAETSEPYASAAYQIEQYQRDIIRSWLMGTLEKIIEGKRETYYTNSEHSQGIKTTEISLYKFDIDNL